MNWTELLRSSIEYNYTVTEGLFGQVTDSELDWKPETGNDSFLFVSEPQDTIFIFIEKISGVIGFIGLH